MKDTVLLVDDNTEMIEVLNDELNERYEVINSYNGSQALEILKHKEVQVIVCDVMMPIMDGFEFCKLVKDDITFSHIPVILLTAKNTLQARINGLEMGADAYIEKPFDPEHLQVQIANLISNRQKLKQFFNKSPISSILSIAHTRSDEGFLIKLNSVFSENIEDAELDIDKLSKLMHTSRTTLFRKIKAISNLTPNELLNLMRLKKAAQILSETSLKVFEVAYMTGFASQTNFGRNFLKQFGMTPTEYQRQNAINHK